MKNKLELQVAVFLAFLKKTYPAGVPRCEAAKASGGLVSAKTLANLSCSTGDVPECEFRIRGRVVYPVESFCEWLFRDTFGGSEND